MLDLSDENLLAARSRGDRDADDGPDGVIRELLERTTEVEAESRAGALRQLWERSLRAQAGLGGDEKWLDDFPRLHAYLKVPYHELLPDWIDLRAVHRGQLLFGKWGPEIILGLLFGSLPVSYACGRGARAVYFTGRLETDTRRRVFETAGFVLDVLRPQGLDPDRPKPPDEPGLHGIDSCRQIRLMHAMLRQLIARTGKRNGLKEKRKWRPDRQVASDDYRWHEGEWGVPINQEDLAGTLADFALVPLLLMNAKERIPAFELEDYIHVWRVVGWLMGIEEQLLPETYDDMEWLGRRTLRHQMEPSEAGRALTQALVRMMEHEIPGRWFDASARQGILSAVSTVDPRLVEVLDLRGTKAGHFTLQTIRVVLELFCVQESIRLGTRSFGGGWGYDLIHALVGWDRGYGRPGFSIPGSLAESWEMGAPQNTGLRSRSWTQKHTDPGPEIREARLQEAMDESARETSSASRVSK